VTVALHGCAPTPEDLAARQSIWPAPPAWPSRCWCSC